MAGQVGAGLALADGVGSGCIPGVPGCPLPSDVLGVHLFGGAWLAILLWVGETRFTKYLNRFFPPVP